MKKILIIGGSLQSENRGINAITRGLLKGIYSASNDDLKVKLLSFIQKEPCVLEFRNGSNSYKVEEISFRIKENLKVFFMHLFFKYRPDSCYKEADLILDLCAGDSFTDIYGVLRYFYVSLPKFISIILKKKLILMPQTIGPFNHKIIRAISKYIINNCYMTYARDIVSYNYLLNDLNVAKTKAALAPDLSFNMPPSSEELIDVILEGNDRHNAPLIGINVSALLFNGGYNGRNQFKLIINYKDLVNEILEYFIKKGCSIVLIPHVINSTEDVEDDYSLCQKMCKKIKESYPYIYTFKQKYREDEIKAIIGRCDFFTGSRMHSCIGAISMGIPTVPVAYSRKFIGIWEQYGMKDCVADAKTMDIKEILNKIDYCYNNRKKIREVLNAELKCVKKEISIMFEGIMRCQG